MSTTGATAAAVASDSKAGGGGGGGGDAVVEVVVIGHNMPVFNSKNSKPELIDVILGEGCQWDSARGVVIWIDILGKRIFEYNPKTNIQTVLRVESVVGCVVPRANLTPLSTAATHDLVAALHSGIHSLTVPNDARAAGITAHGDVKAVPPHPKPHSSVAKAKGQDWKDAAARLKLAPFTLSATAPLNVAIAATQNELLCAAPPPPVAPTNSCDTKSAAGAGASIPNPNRFNDGKCDATGRLIVGTMQIDEKNDNLGKGALYALSAPNGGEHARLTAIHQPVTISNGLAWTKDNKTMYYIDSTPRTVARFDYDIATGTVSNRSVAITLPEGTGWPDGMCIDSEDMIWVAHWAGACVTRWNPVSGQLLRTIKFPVSRISCCCFGGANGTDLYVTSAAKDANYATDPLAGSLFVVRNVGHSGPAANRFFATAFEQFVHRAIGNSDESEAALRLLNSREWSIRSIERLRLLSEQHWLKAEGAISIGAIVSLRAALVPESASTPSSAPASVRLARFADDSTLSVIPLPANWDGWRRATDAIWQKHGFRTLPNVWWGESKRRSLRLAVNAAEYSSFVRAATKSVYPITVWVHESIRALRAATATPPTASTATVASPPRTPTPLDVKGPPAWHDSPPSPLTLAENDGLLSLPPSPLILSTLRQLATSPTPESFSSQTRLKDKTRIRDRVIIPSDPAKRVWRCLITGATVSDKDAAKLLHAVHIVSRSDAYRTLQAGTLVPTALLDYGIGTRNIRDATSEEVNAVAKRDNSWDHKAYPLKHVLLQPVIMPLPVEAGGDPYSHLLALTAYSAFNRPLETGAVWFTGTGSSITIHATPEWMEDNKSFAGVNGTKLTIPDPAATAVTPFVPDGVFRYQFLLSPALRQMRAPAPASPTTATATGSAAAAGAGAAAGGSPSPLATSPQTVQIESQTEFVELTAAQSVEWDTLITETMTEAQIASALALLTKPKLSGALRMLRLFPGLSKADKPALVSTLASAFMARYSDTILTFTKSLSKTYELKTKSPPAASAAIASTAPPTAAAGTSKK